MKGGRKALEGQGGGRELESRVCEGGRLSDRNYGPVGGLCRGIGCPWGQSNVEHIGDRGTVLVMFGVFSGRNPC